MGYGAARSLLLSLRLDGLLPTVALAWSRLFSEQEACVFVRQLEAPATPVRFPVEANGVVVRRMQASDLLDLRVRRHEPPIAHALADGVVAILDGRMVGAAWYTDSVGTQQPWYHAVEPHLRLPARLTANIFVVPGAKGAAWALAKTATDALATDGVRCIVGVIGAENAPSILMSRMLGSRLVARLTVRRRFGRVSTQVELVGADRKSGLSVAGR